MKVFESPSYWMMVIIIIIWIFLQAFLSCNRSSTKVLRINMNQHYGLNSGDELDHSILQAIDSLNSSTEYGSGEFILENGTYYLNSELITKKPYNIIYTDTTHND